METFFSAPACEQEVNLWLKGHHFDPGALCETSSLPLPNRVKMRMGFKQLLERKLAIRNAQHELKCIHYDGQYPVWTYVSRVHELTLMINTRAAVEQILDNLHAKLAENISSCM